MQRLISVKEARELLGDTSSTLTDAQIEQLIDDLQFLARFALKAARQKNVLLGDIASTSV